MTDDAIPRPIDGDETEREVISNAEVARWWAQRWAVERALNNEREESEDDDGTHET